MGAEASTTCMRGGHEDFRVQCGVGDDTGATFAPALLCSGDGVGQGRKAMPLGRAQDLATDRIDAWAERSEKMLMCFECIVERPANLIADMPGQLELVALDSPGFLIEDDDGVIMHNDLEPVVLDPEETPPEKCHRSAPRFRVPSS
mmetsp:Transcript_6120/g.17114  ORF Transcript_6120/g.17114 Transcript_6120/m.17114 type:complete len:146 (+) Transcript_6120:73-510(+)